MRHELKYILTPIQYELLRNKLKWVLKPDANASDSGDYFIRSVYFDSPDRIALKEKLSGINRRKKYRIRFYNGDASYCRLECKEKTGSRIQKISCALTRQQAEELLGVSSTWNSNVNRDVSVEETNPEQSASEDELLAQMRLLMSSEGYAPVVTVDYVREAYILPLSDLRITFDKQLAWGPVKNCLEQERYLSNIYGDHVILEVKYNEYLPEHISAILSSVGPVQTAASKYVACVEAQFAARGY